MNKISGASPTKTKAIKSRTILGFLCSLAVTTSFTTIATITPAIASGPFTAPTGLFQTLLTGTSYSFTECDGLEVSMTVDQTQTPSNVTYHSDTSEGQQPGLHMSSQGTTALGGETSAVTLHFSSPITKLQLRFEAQQAEEVMTFSVPATSVQPLLNSTSGLTAPIASVVSLENNKTELHSDLTAPFDSSAPESFGSNSIVTWDLTTPISSIQITHSEPIDNPRTEHGAAVYNGTIMTDDVAVACDIPNIGNAESVNIPVKSGATYTATFTHTVENMGETPLHDIQLQNSLTEFGSYTIGTPTTPNTYTVGTPTITTNSADPLIVNQDYNGSDTQNILDGDTGSLALNETVTLEVPVTFYPDFGAEIAYTRGNTATATGDSPSNDNGTPDGDTSDTSTNGLDPDPNGDNIPDEQIPTQLTLIKSDPAKTVAPRPTTPAITPDQTVKQFDIQPRLEVQATDTDTLASELPTNNFAGQYVGAVVSSILETTRESIAPTSSAETPTADTNESTNLDIPASDDSDKAAESEQTSPPQAIAEPPEDLAFTGGSTLLVAVIGGLSVLLGAVAVGWPSRKREVDEESLNQETPAT